MFIGVYNLYFKKEGESLLGRYGQSSSRYKPQAWQSTDRRKVGLAEYNKQTMLQN